MRKGWSVFLCFLGVIVLIMAIVISWHYLVLCHYQFTGKNDVGLTLGFWVFLSVLFGGLFLFLGTSFFIQGTPIRWGRLPKNRAFRILSINQFKEKGNKHLLVVPLNKEDANPCYLTLGCNRIPESTMTGQVIVRTNEERLQILTTKELSTEESVTEE